MFLFFFLAAAFVQLQACPTKCTCSSETVICTGLQLTQIPKGIPADTTRLDLQENRITAVRKGELQHLRDLKILQLQENQIHVIEDGAFDGLTSLERLRINKNRLQDIPDAVFKDLLNLHRLDLSENQLSSLTDEQLQGPLSMRNLQLDKNRLICLETGKIASWSSLEIFTVNSNNLTTLEEIEFTPNLRTFRIQDNPWQCDCRLKWVKRASRNNLGGAKCMRPALLHGHLLEAVDDALLKCSGIEKRATSSCRETVVCPPVCTCTETTVDCRDRGLTHVPLNLPISTTELRLEQNQISYIPEKAFKNLKNLQRLDLSKNHVTEISQRAFVGLNSLNSLVLYGNNLTDLPADAFEGLSNLQLLLLNANQLRCIRKGVLDPLKNLNLLSLYDNHIKAISSSAFSKLSKLQTVHLAKNPLICDCNLEWLAELNALKNIETSGARCEAPKRVAKKRFASLPASKFRCKGSEILVTQKADECFIDHECPKECICIGTVVDCSNRGLSSIPEDIPVYTTELILSKNKITELKNLNSLVNLEKLLVSDNELSFIGEEALEGNTHLSELWLTNNRIKCIIPSMINKLSKLRKINLSNNNIPCDCKSWGLINWQNGNSSRSVLLDDCSMELLASSLDEQKCKDEPQCDTTGTYCPTSCICKDTIVRCFSKNLTQIPIGIPDDTTELFLDSNKITDISSKAISGLAKLTKLDMSHNLLESIENHVFAKMSRLSTLILSYNKIKCLQPFAFDGLSSLRILSLYGNDISVLPESAFTALGNITHIAVGSNALHCDCRMQWFSRWIKTRFAEAGIARCVSPKAVENQLILTAQAHQFSCVEPEPHSIASKCDSCLALPCKNGATCETVGGKDYKCQCSAGFHGRNCDAQIDACYGHPCFNNATCKVVEEGRFKCICPKGFSGDRCQVNIDDCQTHKCQNGGKCVDLVNNYRCECPERFGGKYCEKKLSYCTKEMNPCANGARCIPMGDSHYTCVCLPGYEGVNCTENIDDCFENGCQNDGICVDGINSYTCDCPTGFSGPRCEISPLYHTYFQNTAQCHSNSCGQGTCFTNEDMNDYECRCYEGFSGSKCDIENSIGFMKHHSFVALDPWDVTYGNISFTLRTTNSSGLILYYGDEHYLSVELYDGRIKIAFYIGNNPPSHMYSFATVNDGFAHKILIQVNGNKVYLTIDEKQAQSVLNDGKSNKFETTIKTYLYLGGLPKEQMLVAKERFQIMGSTSLNGCISNFNVNGRSVDFSKALEAHHTTKGCSNVVDLCAGVYCGQGTCEANSIASIGFSCRCSPDYEGSHCEKKKITCNKEKYRRYHVEGECRSAVEIKNAECTGSCGDNETCCDAVKVKKRRIKMHCKNGTTYTTAINIIRKCQCASTCKAR